MFSVLSKIRLQNLSHLFYRLYPHGLRGTVPKSISKVPRESKFQTNVCGRKEVLQINLCVLSEVSSPITYVLIKMNTLNPINSFNNIPHPTRAQYFIIAL